MGKRFYNGLYGVIEIYLHENKDTVGLQLYRVNNIDTLNLMDITVKFISVRNLPGMEIEFNVAIEAKIEAHERDYHYDETEEC